MNDKSGAELNRLLQEGQLTLLKKVSQMLIQFDLNSSNTRRLENSNTRTTQLKEILRISFGFPLEFSIARIFGDRSSYQVK